MDAGTVMVIVGVGLIGGIVGFCVGVMFSFWLGGRVASVERKRDRAAADRPPGVLRRIDPKTGLETGEIPRHLRDGPLDTKIGAPLG